MTARPHRPLHAARLVVAFVLFALGVRGALPEVVDDLYISYAYALSLLERGTLAWGHGAPVEGYSNFGWVGVLALGRALALPVTWVAKGVATAAAAGLVVGVHRRAPATWAGDALVIAVGGWSALATWAGRGMETVPFAVALWAGWCESVGALVLAALLRPEGAVYLALGVARRWWGPVRVPPARDLVPVGVFVAYQLWRLATFGGAVPTTVVAKLGGGNTWITGVRQGAGELLAAAPVLVLAFVAVRPARWWPVLLPVAVQATLLVGMRGDWMGDTRMLLPGIVAGLGALLAEGTPRAPGRPAYAALLLLPLLLFNPVRSGGLQPRWLTLFGAGPWTELRLPLLEDVTFAVERLPVGARFETGDIGLPGLVADLDLVDADGLTDPLRARYLAGLAGPDSLTGRYVDDDRLACVRRRESDPEVRSAIFAQWMRGYVRERTLVGGGHRSTWWCRPDLARPSRSTVATRWEGLADRLPEHPMLAWRAALAWADAGDDVAAAAALRRSPWPDADPARALVWVRGGTADGPYDRTARAGDVLWTRIGGGEGLRVEGRGVRWAATWVDDQGVEVPAGDGSAPSTLPSAAPTEGGGVGGEGSPLPSQGTGGPWRLRVTVTGAARLRGPK